MAGTHHLIMAAGPALTGGRIQQMADLEHATCCLVSRAVSARLVLVLLRVVSRIGDWPLSVTVGLLLATTSGARAFAVWAGITGIAILLQKQLKTRCARIRPCQRPGGPPQRVSIPDAGSFPSGHTLHAVMAAVVVTELLPVLAIGFLALALVIGLSRVVLGVHYPSDVAAGAGIGLVLATLALMSI
jgi:undecaprenyl-diphosphatase